jgi:DNA-binding IclR family transcriptional regulator
MVGIAVIEPSTTNGFEPNYRVRALLRGLSLLACFGPTTHELTLTELAERTSLDKVTAMRLLDCLVHERFLRRDEQRGVYSVGTRALTVAAGYHGPMALVEVAEAFIRDLARASGQTAELGILDQTEVLVVAVAHPDRALRRNAIVGERFPFHSASLGKAIVALLDPAESHRFVEQSPLVAVTSRTIVEPAALLAELRETQARGYALDDGETAEGVRCIGAPIRDHSGLPIAAVSIAGAAGEFEGEQLEHYARLVQTTAAAISARLDYQSLSLAAVGK